VNTRLKWARLRPARSAGVYTSSGSSRCRRTCASTRSIDGPRAARVPPSPPFVYLQRFLAEGLSAGPVKG
jgi:hypothetical protein